VDEIWTVNSWQWPAVCDEALVTTAMLRPEIKCALFNKLHLFVYDVEYTCAALGVKMMLIIIF
jgi:hypothetical protein